MPGRGTDSRGPSKKELAQTSVLALPIEEWSLKVSNHIDPDDAEEDLDLPYWAGVLPLHHVWGEPRAVLRPARRPSGAGLRRRPGRPAGPDRHRAALSGRPS